MLYTVLTAQHCFNVITLEGTKFFILCSVSIIIERAAKIQILAEWRIEHTISEHRPRPPDHLGACEIVGRMAS
jgi:hypothetical protein